MKKLLFVSLLILTTVVSFAQGLQSPEQYLGYKIGTRYTRHHKLVDYFKSVAQARPDMVKLEKYGETNEGRELMLAFIASPENLQKLDIIRMNNDSGVPLTRIEQINNINHFISTHFNYRRTTEDYTSSRVPSNIHSSTTNSNQSDNSTQTMEDEEESSIMEELY